MIDAVIFDMDGLMFNTEVMFMTRFRDMLDKNGLSHVPKEVIESVIGCDPSRIKKFESKYPGISSILKQCILEQHEYFYEFFPTPGSANKKGLKELMEYLDHNGIVYAIASSSGRKRIEEFCAYAGFEMHVNAIVSGAEGWPSKPAPDIFLEAARQLEKRPEQCLVLEDSKHGIMAAKRAGMRSVFILDQIRPDEEMEAYIQDRCSDLLEVIDYLENERIVL